MRLIALLVAMIWGAGAYAQPPRVVTDIAPIHSLVAQVMDGVGTPDLLIRPQASPHEYSLRPSEARALEQADLVIWMGEALTPWLEGAIEVLADDAAQIELMATGVTRQLPFREAHAHGTHDHDDHMGIDPHAWLDPVNAQAWLELIARELAELDPENTDIYRLNAANGVAELGTLIQEIDQAMIPVRDTQFLVYHDAYQYFEARFGILAAGAISSGDAVKPGPARVAALRDLVAAQGITCVLTEPQFDPKLANSIFPEKATVGVLDPMGVNAAPGKSLYPAMMRSLAAGFAACVAREG